MEKLDLLQMLTFRSIRNGSLPKWLLKLLRQRGLQNDSNDDFHLYLRYKMEVFRECLKGGSYWDLILQHGPQVSSRNNNFVYYLRYSKQPYV
ncbi:hypothetical protein KFK09_001287 [Dendrobium nobile]|uniref:Uncharacterized protein n=1 Tax=Dendrobium nobile TaxID=94219 RepID=A0A8T3CAE8_DENNO|nr:hypothetical protein KFK09_001287 [Dendrobium nobile]